MNKTYILSVWKWQIKIVSRDNFEYAALMTFANEKDSFFQKVYANISMDLFTAIVITNCIIFHVCDFYCDSIFFFKEV